MPTFAISAVSEDPTGLAGGPIVLVDVTGGERKDYHESLNFDGKYISNAVKVLKPIEEWTMEYELHDTASLVVPFGVALATNYLVTAFSASCSSDGRPTASLTVIKPSAAGMIQAYYGAAMSITVPGGFGVVSLWGATAAGTDYISSSVQVTMQTAEANDPTSGDYLTSGILHYGFKKEATVEAYSTITVPGSANGTPVLDTKQSRDGWKTFSASWWEYMDATTI